MSAQTNILSLPSELLIIILKNKKLSVRDVFNFGETCSALNGIVKSDETLWKYKMYLLLPKSLYTIIRDQCKGEWMREVKSLYYLRKNIYSEIIAMSPKFYRRLTELHFNDIKNIMEIALSRNVSYVLTIWILCDLIKTANKNLQKFIGMKPFTLTEIHYSKIVLQHLFHAYLMIKLPLKYSLKQMTPETVVKFFVQWTDTTNLHLEEEVDAALDSLVCQVEDLLDKSHPLKETPKDVRKQWSLNPIPNNMWEMDRCKQVLIGVARVIAKNKRINMFSEATVGTLDIVQVIESQFGCTISVAAIFEAVARRCGVKCELIVFPNHLYMEWRENYVENTLPFTLDFITGELERRRQCPFAQGRNTNRRFCPDALLKYMCASYNITMGAIRNSTMLNVGYLLAFMAANEDDSGLYRNYRRFLYQQIALDPSILTTPLSLRYLHDDYIDMIRMIVRLNSYQSMENKLVHAKYHPSKVRFAVGMLVYHLKNDYVSVVVGWDEHCVASDEWQELMSIRTLEHGADQPYYNVIAADCTERYVAQENLKEIPTPTRLYHLEDLFAKEFSHYNGFAYVPNDEKEADYPNDGPVRDFYRSRAGLDRTADAATNSA